MFFNVPAMRRSLLTLLASWPLALPAAAASYTPPVFTAVRRGALLPWKRIVTYYGNPLSQRMGILGELPKEQMMAALEREAAQWSAADPATPVQPGLELVATVASGTPGRSGLYRTRMPPELIARVIGWAREKKWITILDVQVGHASVKDEVARLTPFLAQPDVHLALDPEFELPPGVIPGRRIGGTDASEVNVAVKLLAAVAEKYDLPPKVLLVHRFTQGMLTRHELIKPDPRVQVVVVMDGYGPPALKRTAYRIAVRREPVEFAGLKLFYKNDRPRLTPREALSLQPGPSVIIYQ